MNKKIFLVYVLVQALLISTLPVSMVQAAEIASDLNAVSISTLNEIERINDEIIELRMEKANLDEEDFVRRAELENQIMAKKEEMTALGAEKVEHEFLEELLESAIQTINTEEGIAVASLENPPYDIARIAAQFEGMYDISGVAVNYDGKEQYHLIFSSIDNDKHLHKVTTKNVYNSFTANSNEAANFVNDLIEIYGQKLFAELISTINPVLSWVPWELVCSSKPAANQISSSGNALLVTLNTVSTQKFVFVRESASHSWDCCLSTNKVSCAITVTSAVNVNGIAKNESKDYGPFWIDGNWDNATVDANTAFKLKDVWRTCISEISIHSNSKGVDAITQEIHTPMYIIHMV